MTTLQLWSEGKNLRCPHKRWGAAHLSNPLLRGSALTSDPLHSTATWTPVNSTWYGLALTGMSGAHTPLFLTTQPSGRTHSEEWNVPVVLLYQRRCSFRLVSALNAFINQPGLTCRLSCEDKSILSLKQTYTNVLYTDYYKLMLICAVTVCKQLSDLNKFMLHFSCRF